MVEKIFLLGRPGTGKSTIAQVFEKIARGNGWSTCHLYDYKYLHGMFQQEMNDNLPEEERCFLQRGPEACQGFDVRKGKFKVLDTALKQMADDIWVKEQNCSDEKLLLLIEFARKEYICALDIFGYELLKGAHLLYVKLGLNDCIERVEKRASVHRLRSEFDHYVSKDIMMGYYREDDWFDVRFSEYLDYLHSVDVMGEELDNSGNVQELESKVEKIFNKLINPQHEAAEELLIVG